MSLLVFDSEEAATRVVTSAKMPPNSTVEFGSAKVCEIVRDV